MGRTRRIISGLLSIGLAISSVALPAHAEGEGKAWTVQDWTNKNPVPGNSVVMGLVEPEAPPSATWIVARQGNGIDIGLCESVGESPCDSKVLGSRSSWVSADVLLPLCIEKTDPDCVESLSLVQPDGTKVDAVFIRAVAGITTKANKKYKFPKTSTQLLFQAPGVLNTMGTDTYAVLYQYSFEYRGSNTPDFKNLQLSVVPYAEQESVIGATQTLETTKKNGKTNLSLVPGAPPSDAVWMEDSLVGIRADFVEGIGAEVSIRANKKFNGWFKGRFELPNISIKSLSSTQQRITVAGGSVQVPRIFGVVNKTNWQKYVDHPIEIFNNLRGGQLTTAASDLTGAMLWFPAIKAGSKDKAVGANRVWTFATVEQLFNQRCFNGGGLQGVVSTNAATYGSGSPKFEKGFLNYRVAGLHFMPDGTEAIGSYDLIMRSDIARCLYGFSKAPVSATVTITGEGDSNIATTIVGEKNGWLKLSAKGFTFSTKTIKVKLTQKRK